MLDARHDKHEMIFKLSRDITTDSKRLIFSIHRLFDLQDKDIGLKKIHTSLDQIGKQWSKMSTLLSDVKDPSLFQRAFSPGLQEYIEALSLLNVLENSHVPSFDEVLSRTQFCDTKDAKMILFEEILLGIQDIAGEVMRFVTNMVSKGNVKYNIAGRNFLQQMYVQSIGLNPKSHRELGRKISALKGSMIKVEYLCYLSTLQAQEKESSTL